MVKPLVNGSGIGELFDELLAIPSKEHHASWEESNMIENRDHIASWEQRIANETIWDDEWDDTGYKESLAEQRRYEAERAPEATPEMITNAYQERVKNDVLNSVSEFLRFASFRDLMKLITWTAEL
jgi:hypothetical protein